MDILCIPDTQIDPGVNTDHLEALGNYTLEKQPKYIVHLGDHWNMQSLSSYDMGRRANESARYSEDIKAGYDALMRFENVINEYNKKQQAKRKKQFQPEKIFLLGNHEQRIERHVEAYPYLEGKLSYFDLKLRENGWFVEGYLNVVQIKDIYFSHYFVNPDSAKNNPFASSIETQLLKLGFSFVQGHKQGLFIASPRYTQNNKIIRGVIAGSFYSHNPDYLGPQGNNYWRGALLLEDVHNGIFRLTELPLEWLKNKYL